MDSSIDQALEQAFSLIENNQQQQALAVIQPLLNTQPDNTNVWWVYAHAVTDPAEARRALNHVLELDSSYPGAQQLLDNLDTRFPALTAAPGKIRSLQPAAPSSLPDSLPGLAEKDDLDFDLPEDWDEGDEGFRFADEDEAERPKRSLLRRLLLPLLLLIIVGAGAVVVLLLTRTSGAPSATATLAPTTIVQAAALTDTPSNEPEMPTATQPAIALATNTPSAPEQTAEASSLNMDDFRAMLSAYIIPSDGIQILSTNLGTTLRVTICDNRSQLNDAMQAVAENASTMTGIDAIAVQIGDCDAPDSLRTVGVTIDNVQAFVAGNLTIQDFQRQWKPVN